MADMSDGEHGYDWVDDDDLSLAETDRIFEALSPEPADIPPTETTAAHGTITVSRNVFIGVSHGQMTQTRVPGVEVRVTQTPAARPAALRRETASAP